MPEAIFNIFLVLDDADVCHHVQYVAHETELDDERAAQFLRSQVESDLGRSTTVPLAKPFTRAAYYARCRIGDAHHLYDEVFQACGAGPRPLFVTSLVVDGKVRVDVSRNHGDPNIYLVPEAIGDAQMEDWLLKYRVGDAFNIPELINDDYFLAIKLTFNAGHYVSSLKLLLSCVDSLSYIEFGDRPGSVFVDWLREYADLTSVGVTPEELWELRNGVLHMTNLSSRQVRRKKVRRVSIRIGGGSETDSDGIFYFDYRGLIHVVGEAIGRWLNSYNEHRGKFVDFVERYDETISDSRLLRRPRGHGGEGEASSALA